MSRQYTTMRCQSDYWRRLRVLAGGIVRGLYFRAMVTFSMDENGNISRDHISVDELCKWAEAYQKEYFPRHNPECEILIVDNVGGPACFDHTTNIMYIETAATISEKLSRILLLHEMIHVNFIEEGQIGRASCR